MTKVAVVGLGAMGSRIARRLLDSGHELVVWNRDPARTAPLNAAGAVAAESPADASRQAEAVITMVSNPEALAEVTDGPEGVAGGLNGATTVIQMSTVGAAATQRLASALPASAGLLDAPVLGSIAEAESGTLKIYAGGEDSLVERWTPLLSTLGSVIHVGPVGAGSAAKLVANATLVGVIGVLGEALAVAQGLDLPPAVAFEVLETTALADQAKRRRPSVESGEYPARFALSLARKDADLILEAAALSGLDLRVTEAARAWLADAEAAGLGEEDYSAVLSRILRPAGQSGSQANSMT
jgi:3-hydroxyisobutyrate dehydrogenase